MAAAMEKPVRPDQPKVQTEGHGLGMDEGDKEKSEVSGDKSGEGQDFANFMNSNTWKEKAKKKSRELGEGSYHSENRRRNCKEEGHKYFECPKGTICRICKYEGHIAKECPKAVTCTICQGKGHLAEICRNKGGARAKEYQGLRQTTANKFPILGHSQEHEKDPEEPDKNNLVKWQQWRTERDLKNSMLKKNKRIVVTVMMDCAGEKRKPTRKEIKRVLEHRDVDKNKVLGVLTLPGRATVLFKPEFKKEAEDFCFEWPLRAGPDIWATSATIGGSNIKKVIFKDVDWSINDDTVTNYARI